MSAVSDSESRILSFRELLRVEKHEYAAVAWSAAFFFCILSSYYILRPIRETMAVGSGTNTIPLLFTAVFFAMMIATSAFGWIASRYPRRVFMPWVYLFFIVNILAFWIVFSRLYDGGESHVWLGRVFFVWLGVFNAFVVTVFWSFMADIYTREQGRRLFGMITAVGSFGAFLGSVATSAAVLKIGTHNLFLPSAVLLSVSLLCIHRLRHWSSEGDHRANQRKIPKEDALGGRPMDGISKAFGSRYFIAIMGISVIASLLGNALYVFGIEMVGQEISSEDERTRFFSNINIASTAIAAFIQLLVVKPVVRHFGLGRAIAILPVVWAIGFAVVALGPTLSIIAIFSLLARGLGFGFSKPTNHMLYSVVSKEEKYKVKNFIDTAIFRFGDAAASWIIIALMGLLGLGISGVSIIVVPFAICAVFMALWLGRDYRRRARELRDSGVS